MSKLVAAVVAGSGATAASVGGVYILQKGGGEEASSQQRGEDETGTVDNSPGVSDTTGSNLPSTPGASGDPTSVQTGTDPSGTDTTQQPAKKADKKLKFRNLEDFKTNKGYKCSESIFPDNFSIGDLTNVNPFSQGSPSDTDYFGSPATEKNKIKSCLIISGEKKTYTGEQNKGSGTFTGTGSFVNDTKGFIVTNIAETGQETEKLKLTGGAYLLEKKTESGADTGEVKYKKEQTDTKELTYADFEEKFPKVKSDSGVSSGTGNYGGFMNDKEDLKKICESTSCPSGEGETKDESEEFKWSWKQEGSKKISEGSENLNWGDYMFENSSFDLGSKFDSFTGTGTKVTQGQ